jgi:hypothetical protein
LTDPSEVPYFYLSTSAPHKQRLVELSKAKMADGPLWDAKMGGPAFNALIEKYHQEDFPNISKDSTDKPKPASLRKKAEIEAAQRMCRSDLTRQTLAWVLGGNGGERLALDNHYAELEAKQQLFLEHADALPIDFRNLLNAVFLRSVEDYETALDELITQQSLAAERPHDPVSE